MIEQLTDIKQLNIDKSEWKLTKFGELAQDISVRVENPASSEYDRFVGLEHFVSGELKIKDWKSTDDLASSAKAFKAGDILFARRNAYLRRASMVDFDGCCSGDAFVLRENHEKIVPGFLAFIVNSNALWDYANSNAAGTMSKRVKFRDLANYEFLLPPKEQQPQLAELLWAIHDYELATERAKNCTQTLYESIVSKNLTYSGGDSVLSQYTVEKGIKVGPFGSLLHTYDYTDHGVPVVLPKDIIHGEIAEDSVSRVPETKARELGGYRLAEWDILFPRRGDLTKRSVVKSHQEGWLCGTGSIRVRLKSNVNRKLVYFALTSKSVNDWLLDRAVGTTMPNLNVRTIGDIPISLPTGSPADTLLQRLEQLTTLRWVFSSHLANVGKLKSLLINQIL